MPLSQIQVSNSGLPSGADGATPPMLGGRFTEGVFTELLGKYSELARRGLLFHACNQAAQAVSVALAATYTGLCLSNPKNSKVDLHLLAYWYALTVAPAAISSLGIISGQDSGTDVVHTTPLVAPGIVNARVGGAGPAYGKADSAATLPAGAGAGIPHWRMKTMGGFTAAALPSSPMAVHDIAGSIILPAGAYAAVGALTAVTGFGGFLFAELPAS